MVECTPITLDTLQSMGMLYATRIPCGTEYRVHEATTLLLKDPLGLLRH